MAPSLSCWTVAREHGVGTRSDHFSHGVPKGQFHVEPAVGRPVAKGDAVGGVGQLGREGFYGPVRVGGDCEIAIHESSPLVWGGMDAYEVLVISATTARIRQPAATNSAA